MLMGTVGGAVEVMALCTGTGTQTALGSLCSVQPSPGLAEQGAVPLGLGQQLLSVPGLDTLSWSHCPLVSGEG